MLQELTIALRTLIKRPGYALSVVLTLTIGIGASTMMFSLLDAAMLRPLPFAQPDRLVMLTGVFGPERIPRGGSFPEVGDWRTMNRTLVDVARFDSTSLNLRIGAEAVRVQAEIVSPGYFPLLGATAALGRTFLREEDSVPDRDAVAIISGTLWRDRFGRDPAVPLEDGIGRRTSSARFGSALLTVFSGGALLLAGIGLYGLIAYVVGLSRREIAIRLALGADGRGVTALIVRNAMTLVVVGVVIGVGGALAAGRVLESQDFQTRTADPMMYAVVAALLLTVTFVASLLPTRRAVRVAPQIALRGD